MNLNCYLLLGTKIHLGLDKKSISCGLNKVNLWEIYLWRNQQYNMKEEFVRCLLKITCYSHLDNVNEDVVHDKMILGHVYNFMAGIIMSSYLQIHSWWIGTD